MIEDFKEFLQSDKNFSVIDEPAGTGKTEFIKQCVIEYCIPNNISFDLIAFTGKAASVLRSRVNGIGSTIHKFLYEVDYVFDELDGVFKRKNKIMKKDLDVLFVDEASMLSTSVTGFLVNGEKTYLLDELVKKLKDKEIKKIIFIGDSMQLPPIEEEVDVENDEEYEETNESISKFYPDALNPDFLRVHYDLTFFYFNLRFNKSFRHVPENNIYKLSQQLRLDLVTNKVNQKSSPNIWLKNKAKNYIFDLEEALNWYKSRGIEKQFTNIRIFTFTNAKAEKWNREVRKYLGLVSEGVVSSVSINEPLINLMNKPFSNVYNGDSLVVDNIYETIELDSTYECTHEFCKKIKNRRKEFSLHKVDITIFTENKSEKRNEIYIANRPISPNDVKLKRVFNSHLWCDFANRNEELERNRFSSEEKYANWDTARDRDLIYSSVIPSYAYATTTHKTQADSFEFGIIDITDEMKNLKWLYTTLTRIKKEFLIFDNN